MSRTPCPRTEIQGVRPRRSPRPRPRGRAGHLRPRLRQLAVRDGAGALRRDEFGIRSRTRTWSSTTSGPSTRCATWSVAEPAADGSAVQPGAAHEHAAGADVDDRPGRGCATSSGRSSTRRCARTPTTATANEAHPAGDPPGGAPSAATGRRCCPESAAAPGCDLVTLGELHEEIGRGCSSVRSLLTVHTWSSPWCTAGAASQPDTWLPRSRPATYWARSASPSPRPAATPRRSRTTAAAVRRAGTCSTARKRWITSGQSADVLPGLRPHRAGPTAFLVERTPPASRVEPIHDMLGTRASMLAEIRSTGCRVDADALLGPRASASHVAPARSTSAATAWPAGCVGILQACLDACVGYTARTPAGRHAAAEHQLVRPDAHRHGHRRAGGPAALPAGRPAQDAGDPGRGHGHLGGEVLRLDQRTRCAADAVQIHGANGCSATTPVAPLFRDAKVMEIIEGSTQIQQVTIADYAYSERRGDDVTTRGRDRVATARRSRRRGRIKCVVWDLDNTAVGRRAPGGRRRHACARRSWSSSEDAGPRHPPLGRQPERPRRGDGEAAASSGSPSSSSTRRSTGTPSRRRSRQIAARLNIGVDAFAFVDDQAFERDEVALRAPRGALRRRRRARRPARPAGVHAALRHRRLGAAPRDVPRGDRAQPRRRNSSARTRSSSRAWTWSSPSRPPRGRPAAGRGADGPHQPAQLHRRHLLLRGAGRPAPVAGPPAAGGQPHRPVRLVRQDRPGPGRAGAGRPGG